MIPLPEIKVTDKTIPVLESLGVCLNRMIELQMQAYPNCWGDDERREEAEKFLYGGLANAASQHRAASLRPQPASQSSRSGIDFRIGENS